MSQVHFKFYDVCKYIKVDLILFCPTVPVLVTGGTIITGSVSVVAALGLLKLRSRFQPLKLSSFFIHGGDSTFHELWIGQPFFSRGIGFYYYYYFKVINLHEGDMRGEGTRWY